MYNFLPTVRFRKFSFFFVHLRFRAYGTLKECETRGFFPKAVGTVGVLFKDSPNGGFQFCRFLMLARPSRWHCKFGNRMQTPQQLVIIPHMARRFTLQRRRARQGCGTEEFCDLLLVGSFLEGCNRAIPSVRSASSSAHRSMSRQMSGPIADGYSRGSAKAALSVAH